MAETPQKVFAYLDFDVDDDRAKLSRAAAFVSGTDSRYSWTSKDVLMLGGSEIQRVPDMFETDHDWKDTGEIRTHPPLPGCRVVVELFPQTSPLAVENFQALCRGDRGTGQCGKPLHYKGSKVHRVQSGFVVQGGDFVFENGSGGESVFGKKFKDDRAGLALPHDGPGVLSMGNSGKNSNTSQFFLTLAPTPQCDGKHVVFGKVVSGLDVLSSIEARAGSDDGKPCVNVAITDCGDWRPSLPASGFWLDVPDKDAYQGSVPRFYARPRIAVIAPTDRAVLKFCEILETLAENRPGRGAVVVSQVAEGEEASQLLFKWMDQCSVDLVIVAPAVASSIEGFAELASTFALEHEGSCFDRLIISKPTRSDLSGVLGGIWCAQVGWILG